MCSVQIFKFLAKIYIINLIFSQEYIFIAFSQESAFSFSQVSNTHLAKIYTTRIRVPEIYYECLCGSRTSQLYRLKST